MDFRSALCCVSGSDCRRKRGKRGSSTWRVFSLKELQMATNNFNYDNKLGDGGFGSVYWGQLWDGSQIAVKRLKSWNDNGEADFCVEVEILARIRHENLLPLRGYCAEGQERLIVHDYMSNLSLKSHLHGPYSSECHLDWERRMNIAVGVARGIAYLHHCRVIHRNVKSSNVLLDDDFNPRVADFGFAKFIPRVGNGGAPPAAALGHVAPEFECSGKAAESCDVYGFGILLLELCTGKRPVEKWGNSTAAKRRIGEWVLPLAREGRFREIADGRLDGKYAEEEMKRGVLIGLMCSQNRPEKRPGIDRVVELLKGEGDEFGEL
ncbi:hypothetical protein M569_16401, partial [Genlisea aurea]